MKNKIKTGSDDQLFSDDENKTTQKIEQVSKHQDYKFWYEIKPQNKCILRRSYHSCVINNNSMYVYGGYEASAGILSDLQQISLFTEPFVWKQLLPQGGDQQNTYPGSLRNHQAIVYGDQMYIFGGLKNSLTSTGQLWSYSFSNNEWAEVSNAQFKGGKFQLEGHISVLYSKEGQSPKMLSFGGFYSHPIGGYSSSILSYDIQKNEWDFLFFEKTQPGVEQGLSFPQRRASAGMALIDDALYIFGGTNGQVRLDDFWKFDIVTSHWTMIQTDLKPQSRSSTILQKVPNINSILLFGGIHDITHEKNDIWLFEETKQQWRVIEEDDSHRITDQSGLLVDTQKKIRTNNSNKKFNESSPNLNHQANISSVLSLKYQAKQFKPFRQQASNLSISTSQRVLTEGVNSSDNTPSNNMEEMKIRRQFQKKMNMLAEFEFDEKEKKNYKCSSPTTDQMRNSIAAVHGGREENTNYIGASMKNQVNNHKLQMNDSILRIQGHKPCARNGHSAVIHNDIMIVFGGDRHLMSFSDIYIFKLKAVE